MDENPRNIRWLLCALLISIVFCMPAVAMYEWHGFPMQGNAADNAAFAYNGTVASGTVNGDVYISAGHGAGSGSLPDGYTQAFNVPTYQNVKFAHLYTGVWHGTENYQGKLKVEYANASGTHTLYANGTGVDGYLTLGGAADTNDNVWTTTHGVTWLWYDVKDYVDPGDNSATGYTYKVSDGFDGRIYAFKLVVVYENTSEPEVRYWINQGHDALSYATSGHPAKDYGYAYFNGNINPSDYVYAALYCTWLTGDQGDNDTLWFNGNLIDDSCTNYEQGAYFDTRWYVVKDTGAGIDHLATNGNYAKYWREEDQYVHWVDADLVLFKVKPKADLTVTAIDSPVLVDHDSTHGYVVGHDYTVNATITNQGKVPSGTCQAALYEQNTSGRFLVDTATLDGIDAGGSFDTVTFDWHSYVNETVTLEVVADYLGAVDESDEGNNASTMNVNVLAAGQADLDMRDEDLALLPTWKSNDTTVRITVTNLGTGNANGFVVKAYNGVSLIYTSPSMSVAAKGDKVISCTLDASYGGPYPIKAVLDANGNVGESNENNNERTKQLNVIRVMLWNSHHHGNTSTYNGEYSDDEDVVMFKVTKHVPKDTTPWDALHSVASVTPNPADPPEGTYVYGIDGLIENPSGLIYWYLYFNGRRVPNNYQSGVIKLQDGETMHWDFQKQIYTTGETFTPPCTAQSYPAGDDLHPEPFTHGFPMNLASGDGYSRMVWDTTVVYPSNDPGGEYAALASGIRQALIDGGVPIGNVNVMTDTAVTTEKESNNLILIGDMANNTLITGVNVNASKIGMVAYFDTPGKLMVDDDDSTTPTWTHDCGGVVEAFDNPWNGNASFSEPGSIVLMATGVDDANAKAAAEALVNYTDRFNGFYPFTIAIQILKNIGGKDNVDPYNLISVPLVSSTSTLAEVFGNHPVDGDKICEYINGEGPQCSIYGGGQWWFANRIEPVRTEVGYEYWRLGVGGAFTFTFVGRLQVIAVTPIYGTTDPYNLIGYAALEEIIPLDVAFDGCPEDGDKICQYINGEGPSCSIYGGGQWWFANKVEPIQPGVGYEYWRYDTTFHWIYVPDSIPESIRCI